MIVVREEDNGALVVRQCSENTGDVLGLPPAYLFSLDSLLDCFSDEEADTLWDNIEMLDDTEEDFTETGPHVFQLSGRSLKNKGRSERNWKSWCAAHRAPHGAQNGDVQGEPTIKAPTTILEFELVRDDVNPIFCVSPPTTPLDESGNSSSSLSAKTSHGASPPASVTTVDSDGTTKISTPITLPSKVKGGLEGMPYVPTPEQFIESTQSSSKPLKALQRLKGQKASGQPRRERPNRRASRKDESIVDTGETLDIVGILSQVNEQLAAQSDLQGFLKVVVSVVRELTHFSRVMIYQFDEQWNGQVVCELVDWNDTHDLYRGLHFPATDIPKQARNLYMTNKVRLLYDRDQPSARMVCRERVDLESPVDMTHSFLRAMSPIHVKYLANMGVRASMSISVTAFNHLWGLISLHTYGSRGRRVSFPMRQLCRLLGESISRNIERLSYTRRLSARKLINTLPTDANPSGYIISNAEDLLALFDADFGVIAIGNEAKILGPLNASQEVLAVTEYLRIKKYQHVVTSQDVGSDFPDMILPNGLEVIAGLLVIPLSSTGIDFITFLRKAQTRHVNWAGKPFKEGAEGTAVLEPRKSFKVWSETVVGTCRAWKDEELETASVLCLVYGKFISVWRQREQAMQYNQLNKLLLSNATHEVRTPLNHIINYLEMALDSQLDADTRDNLSKSHMASKSLLFVINDLLDLTRHEEGNKLFLQEPFDLSGMVREAAEMHEFEANRRKLNFSQEISPHQCFVIGDAARVRQIVVNTLSNSTKYTDKGEIHLEMRQRTREEMTSELPEGANMEVELSISDTGKGIPREQLEAIFREFEQVESVIADPHSRTNSDENAVAQLTQGGAAPEKNTGIGLGLAIVARVVKNIGGQLRVDSTVGEGSRFTYYLPFRSSPGPEPEGSSKSRSKSRRSNSIESGGSGNSSVNSEINSLVEAISAPHLDEKKGGSGRRSLEGSSSHSSVISGPRNYSVRPTPVVQRSNSSDGAMNVSGSAVPLRSVKVDTQDLDNARQTDVKTSASAAPTSITTSPNVPHAASVGPSEVKRSRPSTQADAIPLPKASADETKQNAKQSVLASENVSGKIPNKSSAAELRLARSKAVSPVAGANPGKAKIKSDVQPLRVLVVEDDQVNRMILKKRLGMEGHKVSLAVHGEDGVQQFEKSGHDLDVILMDLQMPICNGQDACRRIRSSEEKRENEQQLTDRPASHVLNGRIPIFAVSATLDQSMRREMCDIGMDGWVVKPIDFARLRLLMRGVTVPEHREDERWQPGHVWEKGGWLSEPAARPVPGGASER